MNLDLESTLVLSLFLVCPILISLCAAKGWPRGWPSWSYLIIFAATLLVDIPMLLVLYLTPSPTPGFGVFDLLSDTAVVAFGAAWGCLLGFFLFGKLTHTTTPDPNPQ